MKRYIVWVLGFAIAATSYAFNKQHPVRNDLKMKHCHYTATNNPLDVALINKGFFVIQRGNSTTSLYTRLGSLALDQSNFLTSEQGYILGVYTNPSPSNGSTINGPQRIQIPDTISAQSTSIMQLTINFNASEPIYTEQQLNSTVYDQQGATHPLSVRFRKMDDYRWFLDFMIDNDILGSHELVFDITGELQPYSAFANIQWYSPRGMQPLNFDFTSTTQYSSPYSVKKINTDGHANANLTGMWVNVDGGLELLYSDGSIINRANLAVATFDNPKKLRHVIDEIYEQTPLSGLGNIQPANSYGAFISGYLELKNCIVKKKR